MGWLTDLTNWLAAQLTAIKDAITAMCHDSAIWVFDQVTALTLIIINAIPVPDFLTTYSLGGLFSGINSPWLGWMFGTFHLTECFAILGAGVAFNLLRKLLTLGQW